MRPKYHTGIVTVIICSMVCFSCGLTATELKGEVSNATSPLETRLKEAEYRIEKLNHDLQIAAGSIQCKPEVQKALKDLRDLCAQECNTETAASNIIVNEAGGFAVLVETLPHEVFYISSSMTALPEQRLRRLKSLAQAVLPKTQFIVVAFVDSTESEASQKALVRANFILEILVDTLKDNLKNAFDTAKQFGTNNDRLEVEKGKVDTEFTKDNKERFLKGYVDIPINPNLSKRFSRYDLPQAFFNEPIKPRRGVWVFRVHC